jgi:hypothetical protein
MADILPLDDEYVLNYCGKSLARDVFDVRHNYGQYVNPNDPRGAIAEVWRFPIIDSYRSENGSDDDHKFNGVTFVYPGLRGAPPKNVGVVGTFAALYDVIPLQPVKAPDGEPTGYFAVTLKVPKGELHVYRFVTDGIAVNDPVNPQEMLLDNGQIWSRFFTHLCTQPVSFEQWELEILNRLTDHILPFRTPDAQNFLTRFYDSADKNAKQVQYAHAYRLDQPVGVVNFIDKLVAREEAHHLVDYKLCLRIIDNVLSSRRPNVARTAWDKEAYIELYEQMSQDNVPGWDRGSYSSPRYFLQILRRHTYTGAFSHPKYGGNVGAAGWAYLEETYRDANGGSAFDWARALEPPLGRCSDYFG